MQQYVCKSCGYDLGGLSAQGACPECGQGYDLDRLATSTYRPDHPVVSYLPAIGLGVLTLLVLICGGVLSVAAKNSLGAILLTLFFASLPAFGAFVYWWTARQDGPGHG